MKRARLDEHLAVHACDSCEGQWVSSYDYWHWLEWQAGSGKIKSCQSSDWSETLKASDNRRASFCPECHHLMRRAKVGHGLEFYLDRCSHCGGNWFDKGEWGILKAHNIHDKVHLVFSEPWQSQLRQAEFNRVLEETYRSALGDEDYSEALKIRAWLEQHPHRDYILSVLNQVPSSEDESRYIPVKKSKPKNDIPKKEVSPHSDVSPHDVSPHAIAYGHSGHPKPYDYPKPAK
ncbi:zf-TFIIB domain-containing protein [Leptothoe spongobia TAU-MAC 1115]|uniref:Zf-TFIIB domain-containing protein n=1 Tax=Leptothoe spongobia TAU-MAC 1115 TaxID=1967444 RepID=A0A947DDF9_9CYAN|nr:zf-TFIIB domain-containing protein [Leptothoe spongobia TAU-MAC 1115]